MYTLSQWLLFFFLYSFIGWIWESCYVSAHEKRWVNRGFLHGPFIPIYGLGALTVLISTMTVSNNIILLFLFGMTGATILEYFTGAAMEKIFHVKYWDYSDHKFNLNGHICLFASLGWGFFSVIMVKIIHVPIEREVLLINTFFSNILALILTVFMAIDFSASFKEALDLKSILEGLTESKEYIAKLQRRLEIVSVVTIDELKTLKAKRLDRKISRREAFIQNIHELRAFRKKQLDEILSKIEKSYDERARKKEELLSLKEGILSEFSKLKKRHDKKFKTARRLLIRNPKAHSDKYNETLEEIKKLMN